MNLTFTVFQTRAARKSLKMDPTLKAAIHGALEQVANKELPQLDTFRLSLISMSDAELLELNQSTLGHDWFTDIITFELDRTEHTLEAELYISAERALANARRFRQAPDVELLHLAIHGVLHLAGYSDKTPQQKKQMRKLERLYLVHLSSTPRS